METVAIEKNLNYFDSDDEFGDGFRNICNLSSDTRRTDYGGVNDIISKGVRSYKFLLMCSRLRASVQFKEKINLLLNKTHYGESDYFKVEELFNSLNE